jgi:hypothetical protein
LGQIRFDASRTSPTSPSVGFLAEATTSFCNARPFTESCITRMVDSGVVRTPPRWPNAWTCEAGAERDGGSGRRYLQAGRALTWLVDEVDGYCLVGELEHNFLHLERGAAIASTGRTASAIL